MYVHEAAHAIFVHVCGGKLLLLTADHTTGGLCRYGGMGNPELDAAACMAGVAGEEIVCPDESRGNLDCTDDFLRLRAHRPEGCQVDPDAWEQAAIERAVRVLLPRKEVLKSLAITLTIRRSMEGAAVHDFLSRVPRLGQLPSDPPLTPPPRVAEQKIDWDLIAKQLKEITARLQG
jgi:hypothetical protein